MNVNSIIDRFNRDVTVEANVKTTFEAVLNGFVVEADKDGIALDLVRPSTLKEKIFIALRPKHVHVSVYIYLIRQ